MKDLTDLQLDVMRAVWSVGPASVAEIHEELSKTRELAPTTVATLLRRLCKDQLLSASQNGRQLIYAAKASESDVRRNTVRRLRDRLFGGDAVAVVQHLLTSGSIRAGDVRRIQSLIAEAREGRNK
ncbi:MAG: BlaI/MecI/CopY family transcriptional regulator [Thermoanaerobaculia bacterium]